MAVIHAASALTPEGWRRDVRLTMEAGRFAGVEPEAPARPGDERAALVIPGLANLHSHAFQRAMAGRAETRGPAADNFWTWREAMYRLALSMSPDDVEAVTSMLYVEMLEAGFTRVGEFHYLHHDRDGRPYAAPAEMASRIAAAAGRSGLRLTLLPCFYAHATFGGAPPRNEQRRFISNLDQFARLMEASRRAIEPLPGAGLGMAPHSLRAVTPAELAAICELSPDGPIHIHAAEQAKEVEDCLAALGARPVEFLIDNAPLDRRWCLIHATHMTGSETERLALSGACVGLCPVTEANLGDGVFNAPTFIAKGGRFGIGTDSNVLIGVADELRQLEYAQRLVNRERNVLGRPDRSTGRTLVEAALAGGGAALGAPGGLAIGGPADFLSLNLDHPASQGLDGDGALDAWLFVERGLVDCVWVGGLKLVEGGRHFAREVIEARYRATMKVLRAS
ncbi:MAG TPA: formimidoylglutamate deiminase [Roseiarcus sp.]|nr:formimidoylglutamate deiminase [Roseiarcus sp.]